MPRIAHLVYPWWREQCLIDMRLATSAEIGTETHVTTQEEQGSRPSSERLKGVFNYQSL
jgi:hypothetical protein